MIQKFQFTNPLTGKVGRFSANIPAPIKVPIGGYNPAQVAKRATRKKVVKRKKK